MSSHIVDVLVVGGDPVALATALGLARTGVRVAVLDTSRPPHLPWTEVHHWSVLPWLDELGALDSLLAVGQPTSRWGLHVLATGERLTYELGDLGGEVAHPYNLRVDNRQLIGLLRGAAEAAGAVVRTDVRIAALQQYDEGVAVDVSAPEGETRVRARWVVAADGTASAVRRELGVGFGGTTWTERSVVALVEHDFAAAGYPDTTFQVDGHHGAVVERVEGRLWRYVYPELLVHPEEGVSRRIPEVLQRATGEQPRVVDWTSQRMHQRSASTFRFGRVLLVGEAAHTTHHLIGHSSISAWLDASSVTAALTGVLHSGASEDCLSTWAAEQRRVYLDEVVPLSLGRKNLVTQITDPRRLDIELDHFRRAIEDPVLRREVLLQGADLAGQACRPSSGREAFLPPELHVVSAPTPS